MPDYKSHPLDFLVEELRQESSYLEKSMFGCRACYLHGRLVLVLAFPGDEPWNGILVPLERAQHDAVRRDFPGLIPHPVLGKWLYLREDTDSFEREARSIISRILSGDLSIGVEPRERKPKKSRRGR